MFMISFSENKKNLLNHKKKNNEYIPTNEDIYMSQTKRSESINYKNEGLGLLSEDDAEKDFKEVQSFREEMQQNFEKFLASSKSKSDSESNSNSNSNPTPTSNSEYTNMIKRVFVKELSKGATLMVRDLGNSLFKQ